jgi:mannitol-1-phosphate 5-dehydrogenase
VRVVVVGTGKIASGYLAPLFAAAGWEVVLAGRTPAVVERIARAGGHVVRTTAAASPSGTAPTAAARVERVRGLRSVVVGTDGFDAAVADCDLLCTSVGVGAVPGLAGPLARALGTRAADRPVSVWAVENDDCAPALEAAVRSAASTARTPLPPLGVAGAVAHVAVARGSWHDDAEPEFVGDAARRLYVDATRLATPLPELPGVEATSAYAARLREKLYVFNAGHAICAYLGWLRGHATIAQAVRDPFLRPMVAGSLLESRKALLATHPELGTDVHGPVAEALSRYADEELADPVVRVARDPLRKLAPADRLLGPLHLVREQTGQEPPYFSLGVAGALLYRGDDAEQTRELRTRLCRDGVRAVLEQVCGLRTGDPFSDAVATRYAGFILLPDETVFPPAYATPGAPGALREPAVPA